MEKVPQTMTMEEWCVFSHRAFHLGDPRARLMLGRLYKKAAHVKDNMRYALLWLGMAYVSLQRQGPIDPVLQREILEEMSYVEDDLSEEEITYISRLAKDASILPFGLCKEGVPSEEEVERFRILVSQ